MKRLLIVHPSHSFVGALQQRLAGEFEICYVFDGMEALDRLNSFQPDILILHLSMPRKDGLTVLRQADHCPEIIVATTDYLDAFVAAEAHRLGSAIVLLMPMVSTVTQWVDTLLAQSRYLIRERSFTSVLHLLGFRPSLTGYRQLCMAAELLRKNPGLSLSGEIYPHIGQPQAVEKAIRTAIHTAWKEGERQVWRKFFGGNTCPGNKTFLLTLLQPDLHRTADDHGVLGDGAVHGQNRYTGIGGFPEGSTEGGVGGIVGMQVQNILHLDDEEHISAVPCPGQLSQLRQVPGTPDGGSIGEGADAVFFQGDTFYF